MDAICSDCHRFIGKVRCTVDSTKDIKKVIPVEYRALTSLLPKDLSFMDMFGPSLEFLCEDCSWLSPKQGF